MVHDALQERSRVFSVGIKHFPCFSYDRLYESRTELHSLELIGNLFLKIRHFDVGRGTTIPIAFLTVVVSNPTASRLEFFSFVCHSAVYRWLHSAQKDEAAKQKIMNTTPDQKAPVFRQYILTRLEKFFAYDGLMLAYFRFAVPPDEAVVKRVNEYGMDDTVAKWRPVF